MKREILFRGKRVSDGVWVYGDLITKPIHHECCILESGCINHSVDPETVGQYTGLLDKNKEKIFEGDVVKDYGGKPGAVTFEDGCFNYRGEPLTWTFDQGEQPHIVDTEKWATIAGNIYEPQPA